MRSSVSIEFYQIVMHCLRYSTRKQERKRRKGKAERVDAPTWVTWPLYDMPGEKQPETGMEQVRPSLFFTVEMMTQSTAYCFLVPLPAPSVLDQSRVVPVQQLLVSTGWCLGCLSLIYLHGITLSPFAPLLVFLSHPAVPWLRNTKLSSSQPSCIFLLEGSPFK